MLVAMVVGASALQAQTVRVGAQLTLNVPARDFVQAPSGYRTRFETVAGVRASGLLKVIGPVGVIAHGFLAQPDYRSGTTPQSLPNRTLGRVAGAGLQVAGLAALGRRTTGVFAIGPTWFRQRVLDFLSQRTWHSYSSWGISTTAGIHYLLGPHFFGQVGFTYHTYRPDVPPISLDAADPGRRQHDFVLAVGLAYGSSR